MSEGRSPGKGRAPGGRPGERRSMRPILRQRTYDRLRSRVHLEGYGSGAAGGVVELILDSDPVAVVPAGPGDARPAKGFYARAYDLPGGNGAGLLGDARGVQADDPRPDANPRIRDAYNAKSSVPVSGSPGVVIRI